MFASSSGYPICIFKCAGNCSGNRRKSTLGRANKNAISRWRNSSCGYEYRFERTHRQHINAIGLVIWMHPVAIRRRSGTGLSN